MKIGCCPVAKLCVVVYADECEASDARIDNGQERRQVQAVKRRLGYGPC
jgi:hypothetical protein